MNIVIISNCPLVYHQGSGYVILNVSRGLSNRGHRVELYGPENYEPFKEISKAKTYRVAVGMLWLTAQKVFKKKYDVIVYYGAEAWLSLFFFKKLFRSSILMVSNSNGLETRYFQEMEDFFGYFSYDYKPGKWYLTDPRFFFHKAFKWSDAIVTNNEKDRIYSLKKKYKTDDRVTTVDLGIEDEFFNIDVNFSNIKVIGFCGSWIRRKGTDFMVEAIEKTLSEFLSYQFILIGVGHDFKKENIFSREICNRISVYPEVREKSELIALYKTISIFLLPSVYESFGLVAAEAMACGAALVASNSGFASTLKENEALVLKELSAQCLYNSIKSLIENEAYRHELAVNGYRRVQSLRWVNSIKRIESAYISWKESKI